MFIVKVASANYTWFLKSTTWTSSIERASKFETREAAKEGLIKAKKYTRPDLFKKAAVIEHRF